MKEKETKPKGLTRRDFLRTVGALSLGGAAGLVLPGLVGRQAGADTPSALSSNTSFLPADRTREAPLKKRVFIPRVLNQISQAELDEAEKPLWPDKIGEFAPYNVEIWNLGRKAGVEIMDEELFHNLLSKFREWSIAPEVPRRVFVYEDIIQLGLESKIPRPDPPWVSPNFENRVLGPSEMRFAKRPDGSLRMDVAIPMIKDASRLDRWSVLAGVSVTGDILSFLFADKDGNYQSRDRFNLNYRRDGGFPIYKRDENNNNNIISAPLRAKHRRP
jgi:hypothetical protein